MYRTLPTSPNQEIEMTNAQVDTETPDMTITTRLEFINRENEATFIQRSMPGTLRRFLTEDDFERFCNKIDLLLEHYHDENSLAGIRICRLFWIYLSLFAGFFCLFFLPPSASILVDYLLPLFFYLIPVTGIAMFYIGCKNNFDRIALVKQIHAECLELTNGTGGIATFRLETKYVVVENSENSVLTFSHISVLINGTARLNYDGTDNDVICSEKVS